MSAGFRRLPFLSFGFLVANADLLWRVYPPVGGFVGRRLLRRRPTPGAELTDVSPIENGDRNEAITERMIAVETANQPAARVVAAQHHQEAEPDRGEAEQPGRALLPEVEPLRRAVDLHVQVRVALRSSPSTCSCPGRNRSACVVLIAPSVSLS